MRSTRLKSAVVIASVVLSFGVMCLWSYTSTIDNFRVGVWDEWNLNLNVQRGRMEWTRAYAFGTPVSWNEWISPPLPRARLAPNIPRTTLGFWYESGLQTAYTSGKGELFTPADYCLLIVPLWFVLAVVSTPWVVWLWRWYRRTRRERIGFEVSAAMREPIS